MEKVFTLAVWDVGARAWRAFVTSVDRSLCERLDVQLGSHVMVFTMIVEVIGGDDDAVEAALSLLPKVHPEAVFRSYFDLVEAIAYDPRPVGKPVDKAN